MHEMLNTMRESRYNPRTANKLSEEKRIQILNMLVEGSSMRSISRVVGVSINTVTKLLTEAGKACDMYHHNTVRDVGAEQVQCDEIWSFCYAKKKNVSKAVAAPDLAGDVWTWTAIDSDSKLMISWYVSQGRDGSSVLDFMDDLRSRLTDRVQLSTNGLSAYLEGVEGAFGGYVDFTQLIKVYRDSPPEDRRRFSPTECVDTVKSTLTGNPESWAVSTSHVERHNLTMPMSMRRFTRLTNAFSKKMANHCYSLALYFVYYNFIRPHGSPKNPYPLTPAMAAGLADEIYSIEWLADMVDARSPRPGPRVPYRNRENP